MKNNQSLIDRLAQGQARASAAQLQLSQLGQMGRSGFGLGGLMGELGQWGNQAGQRLGDLFAGEAVMPVRPEDLRRHQEMMAYREEMERLQENPEWWHGRKEVPPLEPFERFLGWIDLELRDLRMALLERTP